MNRTQSAGQAVNELGQDEGVRYWRASNYEKGQDPQGRRWVQASQNASWKRFSPFASYGQPDVSPRKSPRGPHTEFLALKATLSERTGIDSADSRAKELVDFANTYGLLGLVYEWYSAPLLPAGKAFVLPDAALTKSGKLRRFNNDVKDVEETEGYGLLQNAVRDSPEYTDYVLRPVDVARPSELKFALKRARPAQKPNPAGFEPYPELSAWEEVKERFGALMLLDSTSGPWARVLVTRELADAWLFALPAYSELPAQLSNTEKMSLLARNLRNDLRGVSPFPSVGEDGELKPGWMCPSLLQAVCLMLYYDLTGAVDIRRCDFCGNYFRAREGGRRAYCPPEEPGKASKCASAASSRAHRERKSRAKLRK